MEQREQIARRSDLSGSERRALLTASTDEWLGTLFTAATKGNAADPSDFCLVAVGGYGRGELSPRSDIDVVLLHEPRARRVEEVSAALWYPIWDAGMSLDHAVRTVPQARTLAQQDFKVLLGLIDARPVVGDGAMVQTLRTGVLADWRAGAAARFTELHEAAQERRKRVGDLSQLLEPDIKEAYGGLRDAVLLRALAASWLVDIPRTRWPESVTVLLDVRDAMHEQGLRDRLTMQEHDDVAERISGEIEHVSDADSLLRAIYLAGREIAFTSDVAWYRALRTAPKPTSRGAAFMRRLGKQAAASTPERTPLADGVVAMDGEVLLARGVAPESDPGLALRAAAAAAQASMILAPATIERLSASEESLVPWTREMRQSFVSLLGAGDASLPIFEALDHAGILQMWSPEWSAVRSLPQRNAIHEFTVDRHLLLTAVHANARSRDVDRPDLLLVAGLLHDIGKGFAGDHSHVGAPIARDIALRMGFDEADAAMIEQLVLHHLLLPDVATRRDLDDPATVEAITQRVSDLRTLELLHALSWADAEATGPAVRSSWRRQLITALVDRCRSVMRGESLPEQVPSGALEAALAESGPTSVAMHVEAEGCSITVSTPDRFGILSTVAGVLSTHRLHIRGARVRTRGDRAAQEWFVRPLFGDPPDERAISSDIRAALAGDLDIDARIARREIERTRPTDWVKPSVLVDTTAHSHTVVEVRAHDEPGLLYRITQALVAADAVVTGAKIDTLGSEVVDAFFITDRLGSPLGADHADAVRTTLEGFLAER